MEWPILITFLLSTLRDTTRRLETEPKQNPLPQRAAI